jgi:hypothetical protein
VRSLLLLLMLLPRVAAADEWRPTLVYETGPAYVLQNDGRYGATGTHFEAEDVGQQDNLVRGSRTSFELAIGRHVVILLYAPFELRTQVTLDRDLQFRDALFAAGSVVDHRYLFDGYRASYLYRVLDGELALEVGGSLQIRSAEVAFTATDGSLRAEQDDIGVVPALKARVRWQPARSSLWAALEADGSSTFGLLDGTTGGLYDVQLTLGHPVGRGIELFLGARLLGGGADVEDKYIDNWANFITFTAGARIALDDLLGTRAAR